MIVNRQEFLNKLMMIAPAMSRSNTIVQSSCVVLRQGWLYSLSRELAAAVSSGLPETAYGAVRVDKLLELLKHLQEEEVQITTTEKGITIKGKKDTARLMMESSVLLPIDSVQRPQQWDKLHPNFSRAIDLSHRCTLKEGARIGMCSVHIHPQWIEACDGSCMIRFPMKTFVDSSVLVRGSSIKHVADLGMSQAGETQGWLHFRNTLGLRMSVVKFVPKEYPPLERYLQLRGAKTTFPRTLKASAKLASIFSGQEYGVRVTASNSKLKLEASCEDASYEGEVDADYDGPTITFSIPGKLLEEMADRYTECEITPSTLRVEGEGYTYVAWLKVG